MSDDTAGQHACYKHFVTFCEQKADFVYSAYLLCNRTPHFSGQISAHTNVVYYVCTGKPLYAGTGKPLYAGTVHICITAHGGSMGKQINKSDHGRVAELCSVLRCVGGHIHCLSAAIQFRKHQGLLIA